MASNASNPSSSTKAILPVKNELFNYAVVSEFDEKGEIVKSTTMRESSSKIKELQSKEYQEKLEAGLVKNPEKVAFIQQISKPVIGTLEGFDSLFPDEKSKLYIINKGLDTHFNSKIKTVLTDMTDEGYSFQPIDQAYDITPDLQAISFRSSEKLSPAEKAFAEISKMSTVDAATLAQIKAMLGM